MEKTAILKNGQDLVYLAACALHSIPADAARVGAMDLDAVYALTQKHSMTAVCAYALEGCDVPAAWRNAKFSAIRKNMLLDAEREEILRHLEKEGCWYMPLKGVILQTLYPKAGMRQMCDNDILIDPSFRGALEAFMKDRGYRVKNPGKGNHDEYEKPPVYCFEIHEALFHGAYSEAVTAYYTGVREKLQKDPDHEFGYHFSCEDFYLYMLAHAYKHYQISGTGLRSLMDVYVYLDKMGDAMDQGYLGEELEKLGMTDFEKESAALAQKLFSGEAIPLTEEDEDVFLYYLDSGTYGTLKNRVDKRMQAVTGDQNATTVAARTKYLLRRLLPDKWYYRTFFPAAEKHKILVPVAILYRFFRAIWKHPKRIWRELRYALRKNK